MAKGRTPRRREGQAALSRAVGTKETRKLKARQQKHRTIWFGLGMFGLIGWSVAIPAVVGVALGIWFDRKWPGRHSWTLMLLVTGVAVGCLNAWFWLTRERKLIGRDDEEESGRE